MDVPLVTVITPVFNAERFVAEALDSVRRQDYEALEVLAVDDGSSDASATVVATIAREWPALRLLRNRHNRGPAAARNAALAAARGRVAVGGSDAHTLRRVGTTWTAAPGRTRDEFLANVAAGRGRVGGVHGSTMQLAGDIYGVIAQYWLSLVGARRPASRARSRW